MFYTYIFSDGYTMISGALDKIEKAAFERAHGKIVSKKNTGLKARYFFYFDMIKIV